MQKYSTREDAVLAEIIAPIQASGVVSDAYAAYDIDAIQDAVLADHEDGYACKVAPDEFWAIVAKHEVQS